MVEVRFELKQKHLQNLHASLLHPTEGATRAVSFPPKSVSALSYEAALVSVTFPGISQETQPWEQVLGSVRIP